jgi:DNA helicase-4
LSIKKIKISWFGKLCRFFWQQDRTLSMTPEGLQLSDIENNKPLIWLDLKHPPVFTMGWLGCTVRFVVNGQPVKVSYLSYDAKQTFEPQTTTLWVNANQGRLLTLAGKIERLLRRRYLRQSYQQSLKKSAINECKRWLPWANTVRLTAELCCALVGLQTIAQWKNQCISDIQANYVREQLQSFKYFFDTVESNPLTQKQREACVVDDDNNLLLAGAGTGKTSVMVGRTGYLLVSHQATASDILLLAYGNNAAKEMDERIKEKLDNDEIKASTFHALGMKVISDVEGVKPSLSPWVNDEKSKGKWVHNTIESLMNSADYRHKILEYFSKYYYVEANEFEFETQGDYYDYLSANDIRSLKGDLVKSFGELYIANWLFGMGIEYQYEARYQHKVSNLDFRQYEPDFYLPEYGLYIEYYGVDKLGNTAPYIDKDEYHASMQWKCDIHKKYDTTVVELFYYQHRDGELLIILEQQLALRDVKSDPLPDEAMLATLYELGRVTELAKLFSQLIGLHKSACLDGKGLQTAIDNAVDTKQAEKAFELLEPVLERYKALLIEHDYIDFEDMIAKALAYVEQGKFSSPWRYIMVDEFQDISEPRARLVRALRDSHAGSSLFCAGDDWQAIYRFSGADVSLTTGFAKYFGPTTTTALDQTFRFNSSIGDVASKFVTQNPAQLPKTITSNDKVTQSAISIVRSKSVKKDQDSSLQQVLVAIADRAGEGATVYLLARFWFHLPDKDEARQLNVLFPTLVIECLSIHAAKGKEADYVVLVGMTKGKHGFPSAKVTPPLMNVLLPTVEAYAYAQERRLLYVALTRARHRVYMLVDMTLASEFVSELIDEQYDVELDEFETSFAHHLMNEINCVVCDTGSLIERLGKFGAFYACSNYPRCNHKENGCVDCGSPMTRKQQPGFKMCLSEECNNAIPLCDMCGAQMTLRKGSRGEFWGCRNYRGKESPSCGNTKQPNEIVL